jgi:tRNA-specific 2-thiouridylase
MDHKCRKVFVALSGGVDSSVAAALLQGAGFDVVGVYMKQWSDPVMQKDRYGFPVASEHCASEIDAEDARRVAEKLGVPFYVWDFEEEYKARVARYMIEEYRSGRTPNPDVMCNKEIKFGLFFERARKLGADYIATGHYIKSQKSKAEKSQIFQREPRAKGGRAMVKSQNYKLKIKTTYRLLAAKDRNKDQSYFLWTLTQEQLKHCLFPIGDYLKSEVREMARNFGLPTAAKKDSQGLCFVGQVDMRDFLREYIAATPGSIVTSSGKAIGRHEGLPFYTIGQRHGIEIGGGIPYYVASKDKATNTLTVAEGPHDNALFSKELTVHSVNWISGKAPKLPLTCQARIRYRQPLQECVIQPETESRKLKAASLNVTFSEAQRAVTPGQSVVFCQDEEILGGGIIG